MKQVCITLPLGVNFYQLYVSPQLTQASIDPVDRFATRLETKLPFQNFLASLSYRARNCLAAAGIDSYTKLLRLTPDDIFTMPNSGLTVYEVMAKLKLLDDQSHDLPLYCYLREGR